MKEENKDKGVSFTLLLLGAVHTLFRHSAGMVTTELNLGVKAAPTSVVSDSYEAMKTGKDRVASGRAGNNFLLGVINNILPDTT